MYMIVGLGNPSKEYEHTRHNVGFSVIDVLANRFDINVTEKKHRALFGKGRIEGHKVILVKPQTFMNLSGESVRAFADYYKIEPTEIVVIFDDVSLPLGQLRIRKKGSAGGHNGIKNIITQLGSQEFLRIKVGIDEKPNRMELADYVLSRFSKGEQKQMDQAFISAAEAVVSILEDGVETAMNYYNRKKEII